MTVKEKRKPKLAEGSFIVPGFEMCEVMDPGLSTLGAGTSTDVDDSEGCGLATYNRLREEKNVTYNHFVSVAETKKYEVKLDKQTMIGSADDVKIVDANIINGYDGFSGAHDNLIWTPNNGTVTFTLNNKVITEHTKTRTQQVFVDSSVRLSTIC